MQDLPARAGQLPMASAFSGSSGTVEQATVPAARSRSSASHVPFDVVLERGVEVDGASSLSRNEVRVTHVES